MSKEHETPEPLWSKIAWSLPVALIGFAVFALPLGSGGSQVRIGLAVAVFFLGLEVWKHFWPGLKAWLLARGMPSWCVEDGWRGNALISGIIALAITVWARSGDGVASWLKPFPALVQFGFIFVFLFTLKAVGERFKHASKLR